MRLTIFSHLLLSSLLALSLSSCRIEKPGKEKEGTTIESNSDEKDSTETIENQDGPGYPAPDDPDASSENPDKSSDSTQEFDYNVGFVMIEGVFNSELMAPFDIFHHTRFREVDGKKVKGMNVFTVSHSLKAITTFEGLRILPDYSFENAPKIDILVVPSAEHNLDTDLEDEVLIDFVRDRGTDAAFVLSLCDGAFVLAKAGLLTGYHATTFPGDIDQFEEQFEGIKVEREVSFVHELDRITSAGGAASYEPSLYLVELLYGKKAAEETAKGMVIDWDLSKLNYRHYGDI